jgi:hypothetical protein
MAEQTDIQNDSALLELHDSVGDHPPQDGVNGNSHLDTFHAANEPEYASENRFDLEGVPSPFGHNESSNLALPNMTYDSRNAHSETFVSQRIQRSNTFRSNASRTSDIGRRKMVSITLAGRPSPYLLNA